MKTTTALMATNVISIKVQEATTLHFTVQIATGCQIIQEEVKQTCTAVIDTDLKITLASAVKGDVDFTIIVEAVQVSTVVDSQPFAATYVKAQTCVLADCARVIDSLSNQRQTIDYVGELSPELTVTDITLSPSNLADETKMIFKPKVNGNVRIFSGSKFDITFSSWTFTGGKCRALKKLEQGWEINMEIGSCQCNNKVTFTTLKDVTEEFYIEVTGFKLPETNPTDLNITGSFSNSNIALQVLTTNKENLNVAPAIPTLVKDNQTLAIKEKKYASLVTNIMSITFTVKLGDALTKWGVGMKAFVQMP